MKKILPALLSATVMLMLAFTPSAKIPYNVNKRPLPKGTDFTKLIPETAGSFKRAGFHEPSPDSDGDAVYYGKDSVKIFMLFGKGSSFDDVQSVFDVVCREATDHETVKPDVQVKQKDPSYILISDKKGSAFFGWTRGEYYFSVESPKGKSVLDEFMKSFRY